MKMGMTQKWMQFAPTLAPPGEFTQFE